MKLFEKIILSIHVFFILVHFTFFDFEISFYFISNLILVLAYFFGGYWLLYRNGGNRIIALISGVIFALSLYPVPYKILLNDIDAYMYFPILNILLFITLFYFFIIKKTKDNQLKSLFYHSLFILLYSCFFIFGSVYFKPFRTIVYYLNSGNINLQSNLLMFDNLIKSEKALEQGDCDGAINAGLKSIHNGSDWLGLTLNISGEYFIKEESKENFSVSIIPRLDKISYMNGTFTNLYKAYRCKADNYYYYSQYDLALDNYLKADAYLNLYNEYSTFWKSAKAYSKRDIAMCYEQLDEFDLSDSVFNEAIDIYYNVNDTLDFDAYSILINYSELLSKKYKYAYSNQLLNKILLFFPTDVSIMHSKKIYRVSKKQVSNYIGLGMFDEALAVIDTIESKFIDSSFFDCTIDIYKGVCYYRKDKYEQANTIFSNNINCLEEESSDFNFSENYKLLGYTNIALANYDKALNYVDQAKKVVLSQHSITSPSYASCLKIEAKIYTILGHYQDALKLYNTIESLYLITYGKEHYELCEVYMLKSRVQVVLGDFIGAKIYLDKTIDIIGDFNDVDNPFYSSILDNVAYVNYYLNNLDLSEQIYCKVLELNSDSSNAVKASVINGLALVNVSKYDFSIADSLFVLSKGLHQKIYSIDHPLTANVYLNYSRLKLNQDSLAKAEGLILESIRINKLFFEQNHDVFADAYSLLGDLEFQRGNRHKAVEFYLIASAIYESKFSESYFKQVTIQDKIKSLNRI